MVVRSGLVPLVCLLVCACANPAEPDRPPKPDAGPARDAGPPRDAGVADAGFADASVDDDAGVGRDAGVAPCSPTGRQHIMFGSAQNPQTITFGEGLPNERTLEVDGAYLASFDSGGCFEWLALMPAQQGSFGGSNLLLDDDGNIYFGVAMNGDIQFRNADDTVALTISSTATTPAERFRRGIAIVSYDRRGFVRWVRRMGNGADDPTGKGYSVASLALSNGRLRVVGSANGATNGPADDYEVVFGLDDPNETRVTIGQRFQFGFVAALDPDSGGLLADTVRVTAPVVGATNYAARHNGRGAGREADDGAYGLGLLYVGSAGDYVLDRGSPGELTVSVVERFVAAFARYDATGALAWHRFAGAATGGMSVFSSETLADGGLFFSGGASEQADFAGVGRVVNLAAGASGYLVRYDATGDVAWLRGFSGRGLARLLVDEANGALFAVGNGDGDVVFGVGDADAATHTLGGPFVARFDLASGALTWLSGIDGDTAAYRDLTLLDGELLLGTRFDDRATFAPGTSQELAIDVNGRIWSGLSRYDPDDGTFLGVIEYVLHRGTPLNDGLNVGGVYQP